MHFQVPSVFIDEVNQINRIVAIPSFPAFVIFPHPSEHDGESVFVDDGWVIAPGVFARNRFMPSIAKERVNVNNTKCLAAMSPDDKCLIFEND